MRTKYQASQVAEGGQAALAPRAKSIVQGQWPTFLRQSLQAFLLMAIAAVLGGCAITIQQPSENATVTLPSKTKVVVTGNASYSGLKVTIDGIDVSNQLASAGTNRDEGDVSVAAGTHLITATAEMYCWYCSGSKTLSTDTNKFTVVANAFIDIEAGESHTCAVAADNRAYCWGDNTHGQLGTGGPDAGTSVSGQFKSYATPADSTLGAGLSAGAFQTCAFSLTGSGAACWGANNSGQLGGGWPQSSAASPMPVAAPGAVGSLTRGISAGTLHTCALFQSSTSSNIVPVCAGNNSDGQLGNGSQTTSNTFVRAFLSNPNQDFFKVSAGGRHSCALNVTGRLSSTPGGTDFSGSAFCWGDNSYGQVGQTFQQFWPAPTLIHQP